MILALLLVVAFALVATVDGLYFHLWKYRLYARPESQYEHLLHTANVCVFVPQLFLFFCVVPRGPWLALAALLTFTTLAIEVADVRCEGDSRRSMGGLSSTEYLLHFLMSGLRMGFVCAIFATSSLDDFMAPASLGSPPLYVRIVGVCLLLPGIGIAGLHVALLRSGRRQLSAAHRPATTSSALG
jgi:hypothetical protein